MSNDFEGLQNTVMKAAITAITVAGLVGGGTKVIEHSNIVAKHEVEITHTKETLDRIEVKLDDVAGKLEILSIAHHSGEQNDG